MKKKIFFVSSSLAAGGAEKVFWLLCNYFNKSEFELYLVLLDSKTAFFSLNIPDVEIIDLKTVRASKSFLALYKLLKKEKPYAVFSTGGQIDYLVALLSFFVSVPLLIARGASIPNEVAKYSNRKSEFLNLFSSVLYKRFDKIVCQSDEMKAFFSDKSVLPDKKLVVIPNPIIPSKVIRAVNSGINKKLIIVGRLVSVKGHERLLDIFRELPENYILTIAGDGPLSNEIKKRIRDYGLENRIHFLGQVDNIPELISEHDLLVLSSYTEGFPNVVIESISVGTPVVTFKVGGVSKIILDGFNGYIVTQGDHASFGACILSACEREWDSGAIKKDTNERFGINKIVARYEALVR